MRGTSSPFAGEAGREGVGGAGVAAAADGEQQRVCAHRRAAREPVALPHHGAGRHAVRGRLLRVRFLLPGRVPGALECVRLPLFAFVLCYVRLPPLPARLASPAALELCSPIPQLRLLAAPPDARLVRRRASRRPASAGGAAAGEAADDGRRQHPVQPEPVQLREGVPQPAGHVAGRQGRGLGPQRVHSHPGAHAF